MTLVSAKNLEVGKDLGRTEKCFDYRKALLCFFLFSSFSHVVTSVASFFPILSACSKAPSQILLIIVAWRYTNRSKPFFSSSLIFSGFSFLSFFVVFANMLPCHTESALFVISLQYHMPNVINIVFYLFLAVFAYFTFGTKPFVVFEVQKECCEHV